MVREMIRANLGEVNISGIKGVIRAEFCMVVAGMAKAGFSEEELHDFIKIGLKSEEELESDIEAKREEVQKRVDELLDRIFGKVGKDNGSK